MIEKIEHLVQEVLEMAAEADTDPRVLHAKGIETKQALWDEFGNMQRAISIIDGVIPYKTEGLPWSHGWVDPSAIGTQLVATMGRAVGSALGKTEPALQPLAAQRRRTSRVLALAQDALNLGRTEITTDEIAETLQTEGDTTARRSLQTGVGNILSRTGKWERVRTGEYRYTGVDGEV